MTTFKRRVENEISRKVSCLKNKQEIHLPIELTRPKKSTGNIFHNLYEYFVWVSWKLTHTRG